MYWYIKYPLIVILVLCLLGITGFIWRSCDRRIPEKETGGPDGGEEVVVPGKPVVVQPPVEVPGGDGGVVAPVVQPVSSDVEKRFTVALNQLERGKLEAARQIARQILKMEGVVEYDPTWRRAVKLIDDIDRRLMNSSAPAAEKKFYRVVKGDSLAKIASRNYTSIGALIRCNAISYTHLTLPTN